MNVFVASWFFPPSTSSEGIVTYKLLRNSRHNYDVFSSASRQWGYKASMCLHGEKNINAYTIETDDIQEWADACVAQFETLYPQRQYRYVMTRSTPPESILVGQRIKERYPQVKWIASLADPVANNPYDLKFYIDDCSTLFDGDKSALRQVLRAPDENLLKPWENRPESGIRLLCRLKRWENIVLKQADIIVSPTGRQLRYITGDQSWNPKFFALPHSFDPALYPDETPKTSDKIIFSYIGYSDNLRSLEPIVRAVRLLAQDESPFLDKLEIRFIGNYPRAIQDMILDYYLEHIIKCCPGVDYEHSLALMKESDWLIHVDAFFPELQPGGSIFFAGKLADYMGANRPVLALTGEDSPACQIVRKAGGSCFLPEDIVGIANGIEQILSGRQSVECNQSYIQTYRADCVAARFDRRIEGLLQIRCTEWPHVEPSADAKLVTICVPSYNVQRYLERCLRTLVNHTYAPYIEVLVIDDGSTDQTAAIAQEFEKRYPGVVRLIHQQNGGHGSTINRAIREGRGKYFMVVDGDDWIDSEQFAALLTKVHAGEIDSDVISANYHHVNMETGICTPWYQQTEVEYFREYTFDQLDTENIYFTLASSFFKLDILKRVNMPLQEHTFYVDVEYILFPVPHLKTAIFVDYYIYKYMQGNAEQSIYIPTMVSRYEHHDRVMRRVLHYGREAEMGGPQQGYYDAVLKRLLYTHYGLCLIHDENRERGYTRCEDFDRFLIRANPVLARWAGKKIPELRIARRYRFNAGKAERSIVGKIIREIRRVKPEIKSRLKRSCIFRKLINNRFTRSISKIGYFKYGTGYRIRQKMKGILSS